jgi:hypothetical protein
MDLADLDELSYDLEEDGRLIRRQLDRRVVEHRGWATVVVLYQELDARTDAWRPPRAVVMRFRRQHDRWRKHAAITIGSAAVGEAIALALTAWFQPGGPAAASDDEA